MRRMCITLFVRTNDNPTKCLSKLRLYWLRENQTARCGMTIVTPGSHCAAPPGQSASSKKVFLMSWEKHSQRLKTTQLSLPTSNLTGSRPNNLKTTTRLRLVRGEGVKSRFAGNTFPPVFQSICLRSWTWKRARKK